MKRLRRALLILIPLIVALGVSGVLYLGTRAVDEERHAAILGAIERERHLHALLKRDVLAARFGLLTQYDPLESVQADADATRRTLHEKTEGLARGEAVAKSLDALDAASKARRDRIESFKTQNSVLKNSLHYLPVAADLFAAHLDQATHDGAEAPATAPATAPVDELKREVNSLVQATLVYNLIGGEDRKRVQEERLAVLDAKVNSAPESVRTDLSLLLAHARTVERESGIVDPLLDQILDEDVEDAIASLEKAYQTSHNAELATASRYRLALYGWSVFLLLAVVLSVTKLAGLYTNLEKLVEERTRELRKALDALWGEMHLAKEIQTALVPTMPMVEGCDVAAAMRPAEQVGGDYYDVLTVRGVEWVLIGDVSGHGVPAGLVMMMCQTAVRAILEKDPHVDPGELLVLVNRALTQNIKRLGENKYMTLQALRKDPTGFTHAGLHQDLLIFRAATGKVEAVKPNGMWLGIVDDLGGMVPSEKVLLDPDDVLLLFTDGITEAMRDGKLLDNLGLTALLEEHGRKTATEIVEGILAALADYDVDDDVSLLVIRQKKKEALVNGRVHTEAHL